MNSIEQQNQSNSYVRMHVIAQANGWGSATWEYELPNATAFIELRNLIA